MADNSIQFHVGYNWFSHYSSHAHVKTSQLYNAVVYGCHQ